LRLAVCSVSEDFATRSQFSKVALFKPNLIPFFEKEKPMNNNMLAGFERLVRETHKSEAELMTLAFRAGVRQLWRERFLGCYLRGEIGRDEAVKAVGIDWVELAERQREAVLEDLEWALKV